MTIHRLIRIALVLFFLNSDFCYATDPTISSYAESTWTDTVSTSEVTGSISWSAGDFIVVLGATEDSALATLNTPTASGLTFSLITSVGGASNAIVYAWSATAGSAGSGAVTATVGGTTRARGLAAFVFSGSEGLGNTGTITGSSAKVISLTRASADSAVVTVFADWNALTDVTVTASPSADSTIRENTVVSGRATFFVISWLVQGAAGTTSYGYTAQTGTSDNNGIALEIKGTATVSSNKSIETKTGIGNITTQPGIGAINAIN